MGNYSTFLGGEKMRVYGQHPTKIYRRRVYFGTQALDAGEADAHQVIPVITGDIVHSAWINVIAACPANATADLGYGILTDHWGNGLPLDAAGVVSSIISGSLTWQPSDIRAGQEETTEIIVDGASIGDIVTFKFPSYVDLGDMTLLGNVQWANRVLVQLINNTPGQLWPPSFTITAIVNKAPFAGNPWIVTAADTIDVKATTDTADVNISSGVIDVYARITRF